MPTLSDAETTAARQLIELALVEDVGPGDATTHALISRDEPGAAVFVARSTGIIAGQTVAALVMQSVDPRLRFSSWMDDGARASVGDRLARVEGLMASILTAERTALNFLQRLSGVATQTRKYVDVVADLPVQLLDTRKTTPGWRLLEKYAVRMGGGVNHRRGLYDGILIKDNHLAALQRAGSKSPVVDAVRAARRRAPPGMMVEVEVDSLEQLEAALSCGPDIVLLDNMTADELREAVRRRDAVDRRVRLEASGGVTLSTLRAIAETGVDRISIGALTHSAVALDLALDYETS